MDNLRKINSMQLYYLWRNLAISLLCIGMVMGGSHMLPPYMAPVLSLSLCAILYTMLWNNRVQGESGCMVIVETMLYSLICYTFISVLFVVIQVLELYHFPNEIIFFNDPFLPSLILLPTSLAVTLFALFFKNSMPAYRQFRTEYGNVKERGYFGFITGKETDYQLKNLSVVFSILTCVIWWYYLNEYVNINQNGRDWYVFLWIVIIMVFLDEVYFMIRYYNLYLDLLEHNEIITPEELRDVTARTYLRFYVICGEYVYVDPNAFDRLNQIKGVYDSPFITKRTVNGIPTSDVRRIVEDMTGQKGGELRFFFGRPLAGVDKHSLLRYFYFLDGDISDYPDMKMSGQWVHFDKVKQLYSLQPGKMATNALNDLSRLSTIILTERLFDEDGNRKNRIKSYKGSFSLADVRNSKLDLQDDKWIKVAQFNSDTRFFKLKKFLRELYGNGSKREYQRKQ
ncbi:MAG: hypothetical protein K2K45_12050 [Muribaculaceae bacterium]|nr:hypothetical protein [Muribaculaceae bacterium]